LGDGLSIIPWLLHNWILIVAVYIPAGVLTAAFRWLWFCYDNKCKLEEQICSFKARTGLANPDTPMVPNQSRAALLAWLYTQNGDRWVRRSGVYRTDYVFELPTWRQHKARILTWMCWWWIVGPWSLLHDVVHRAFRGWLRIVGDVFDVIARRIYGDVKNNFVDSAPVAPTPDADV
jgi:hypothetical protein